MGKRLIYSIADEENYQDGQVIIREGTAGDWVYVVLSGSVELSKNIGGQNHVIASLGPGEVFGEFGFLGKIKRTATARAVGETTVGIVDSESLLKEYNQLSSQFRSLLSTAANRFETLLKRFYDSGAPRGGARVTRVLSLVYKDHTDFFRGYTDEYENGGLFVRTKTPLEVGEGFLLKLNLPGISRPLQIKCEVTWVRTPEETRQNLPSGMKIKFKSLANADAQALSAFLNQGKPD